MALPGLRWVGNRAFVGEVCVGKISLLNGKDGYYSQSLELDSAGWVPLQPHDSLGGIEDLKAAKEKVESDWQALANKLEGRR